MQLSLLLGKAACKRSQAKSRLLSPDFALPYFLLDRELRLDLAHYQKYQRLFRWQPERSEFIHPCYLHLLAFPLHLKIMTSSSFPFATLGLVHLGNQIEQHQPLNCFEKILLRVSTASLQPHAKGWTFDIVSEAYQAGTLVWSSRSRNLYRLAGVAPIGQAAADVSPTLIDETQTAQTKDVLWHLPANLGCRYAAISGDFNLIHLHPWLARMFGFKQHIVHGMWSKARVISELLGQEFRPFRCEVSFKKPVFLPAQVKLSHWQQQEQTRFMLLDDKDQQVDEAIVHMTGELSYHD